MIKVVFIPGLDGSGLLFKPLAQRWPSEGPAPHVRLIGLDTPHYLLQDKPGEALREIEKFAGSLIVPA